MASVLSLGLCSLLSTAMASRTPYEAWSGERHAPPAPHALERDPPARLEEPELARRTVELVPELGVAVAHCAGSGAAGCASLGAGVELGLGALYRTSPSFAFGASFRADEFSFGRTRGVFGRALFGAVSGRVYLLESGRLDPYLELALGAGSLSATRTDRISSLHDAVDFAPAARVSGGLDLTLTTFLRAGASLGFTEYAVREATRCGPEACRTVGVSRSALATGATSFGLHLTFTTGERL